VERFWVIRNLQRTGPFSEAQILRAYEQGELQPNDLLWADGVSTPVTVASAFAQLPVPQTKGASEELVLEPIEPQPETVGAGSPYRPPRAAVDDFSASAGGEPRYAGFWVRFSAAMLDSIIVGVAYAILAFALRPLRGMLHLTPGTAPVADIAVQTMLMWLYVALGESGPHSATWGKRAFGLQVLGSDFLDRISFLRATLVCCATWRLRRWPFKGISIERAKPRVRSRRPGSIRASRSAEYAASTSIRTAAS